MTPWMVDVVVLEGGIKAQVTIAGRHRGSPVPAERLDEAHLGGERGWAGSGSGCDVHG